MYTFTGCGLVAQWIERLPPEQKVVGSNPIKPTFVNVIVNVKANVKLGVKTYIKTAVKATIKVGIKVSVG